MFEARPTELRVTQDTQLKQEPTTLADRWGMMRNQYGMDAQTGAELAEAERQRVSTEQARTQVPVVVNPAEPANLHQQSQYRDDQFMWERAPLQQPVRWKGAEWTPVRYDKSNGRVLLLKSENYARPEDAVRMWVPVNMLPDPNDTSVGRFREMESLAESISSGRKVNMEDGSRGFIRKQRGTYEPDTRPNPFRRMY